MIEMHKEKKRKRHFGCCNIESDMTMYTNGCAELMCNTLNIQLISWHAREEESFRFVGHKSFGSLHSHLTTAFSCSPSHLFFFPLFSHTHEYYYNTYMNEDKMK